jgi:hypothetical protein
MSLAWFPVIEGLFEIKSAGQANFFAWLLGNAWCPFAPNFIPVPSRNLWAIRC